MSSNKIELQILNEDGTVNAKKQYKTLRQLANELGIDYHTVRELNAVSQGKVNRKFSHNNMTMLLKKFRIVNIQPVAEISLNDLIQKLLNQ